jgi:hypothetical protein
VEVSVQLHAPTVIPPGKEFWFPFNGRLDGPQSRSRYLEEKKISCPSVGNSNLSPPDRGLVTMLTALCRIP